MLAVHLLAGLVLVQIAQAVNVTVPTVSLGYAEYRGIYDPVLNVSSFLGVRYAAKPNRFQAPSSPPNVTGIQNATSYPTQCWQELPGLGLNATNPFRAAAYAANETDHIKRANIHRRTAPLSPIPFSEDCLFLKSVQSRFFI